MSLLIALTAGGCAHAAGQRGATPLRTLPADSAALFVPALRDVRPAFATQAEALRSSVYAAVPPSAPRPPASASGARAGPVGGIYVIQIAAYRQRKEALRAADAAGERYPHLEVRIEVAGEQFRVALGSWPLPTHADATLRAVRQRYPDAWLRRSAP